MEHNFSAALTKWREINLTELQKTLDEQGIELVDNQKESVVGRKALADKTKDFKKIPDAEKPNAFKNLLKAYQTEIDNLTKRSKTCENAFLNVYKVLAEAPDPYPLLEAAVDQTVKVAEATESEAELRRLREENATLRKRASDFSNFESARRKVEARVEQLETKMEAAINEKVLQKENELNATYDEKLRNYEEREQDLQRQVALVKTQLRDLRMSNDSNEAKLLNHSQRQDQEIVAKLAEMDMLVSDLDQSKSRVAAVERRNEILRAEIEALRSGTDVSDHIRSLEAQVSQLEGEAESMSSALEAERLHSAEREASSLKKAEEDTKELHTKVAEVELLKQKLKQYLDYDEIKRELEIMKYVEFAGLDDDGNDTSGKANEHLELRLPDPNAEKANARVASSLEVLLALKNKRILEELTKFRILHAELEESLRTAHDKIETMTSEMDKQKSLTEQLENDLLAVNKHGPANGHSENSDQADDILSSFDFSKTPRTPASKNGPIPFVPSADASILPIVTSQRDRFRQRNAELEEELRKQFQIISELRTETKSLQSDNLKLYEKVRYMQSYREEAGSRPPISQLDPLPAERGRSDDISKYQTRYEEAMNPFEAFRGREATRVYSKLNPVERGVLILTRSILGSRRARTLFVVYSLALHLLVVYTSYECSISSGAVERQPSPF